MPVPKPPVPQGRFYQLEDVGYPAIVTIVEMSDDGDFVVKDEDTNRVSLIPKANFVMYYASEADKQAADELDAKIAAENEAAAKKSNKGEEKVDTK